MLAGFCEGILLPVPMEVLSLPIYLASSKNAAILSCLLVVCSVTGSILGYFIGEKFGNRFLAGKDSKLYQKLEKWYGNNAFVTILTSAFTPIPFELYVLSAGIFRVNRKLFFSGVLISRMVRHLPQGIVITLGREMQGGRTILSIGIVAVIVLCYFGQKKLKKRIYD